MHRLILALLFSLQLFSTPTHADEKPEINWLIWELSPEFIRSGPLTGQGYADKFLAYFIERLPEYKHQVTWLNVNRWNIESQKTQHCTPHVWGDFFKDSTVLSKPYTFTAPHKVIFHKRYQERFGPADTTLSLEKLLTDESLRLMTLPIYVGQEEKHARYPVLHTYLKPYIGKPNLIENKGGRNEVNLKLLQRQRIDYAIGYPNTITSQRRINGLDDEFINYRLKEHNLYKKIYVSCRDTNFGNEVIRKINAMLTEDTYRTFLSYQEEWNGGDAEFRKITLDHFINGIEAENIIP